MQVVEVLVILLSVCACMYILLYFVFNHFLINQTELCDVHFSILHGSH